ncbi:DUF2809 domain-containing protein [Epidermidibacterium keratini]|uniref:DUF2809 domain-containing protein n=1 Tax=Epidermidibacterium keratini TaxID=1891644 RepID=A0A7L4YNB3_9ACTN|nr:DUF2809 domain-containing protein [Epidermidibacterium keratini]QHC00532.1 DUF2809 domain-containing protein [Epidermidibacterium keratini]
MPTPTRRSALIVLLSALVIGLAVQPFRDVAGTDAIGSAAYAAAAVGVWGLILPGRGARLPGLIGTGLACAVELLQLTGLPQRIAEVVPGSGFVLGGQFDIADIIAMLVGGIIATFALAAPRLP